MNFLPRFSREIDRAGTLCPVTVRHGHSARSWGFSTAEGAAEGRQPSGLLCSTVNTLTHFLVSLQHPSLHTLVCPFVLKQFRKELKCIMG